MQFQDLFPTPVLTSNLGRPFNEDELAIAHFHTKDENRYRIQGNYLSVEKQVLARHKEELSGIVDFISSGIEKYIDEVFCPPPGINFYISNSWFTFCEPGQSHQPHQHQNCVLSGTFYFHAQGEKDSILFHNYTKNSMICFPHIQENRRNTLHEPFPCNPGDLFLFPPDLYHSVPNTQSDSTRVCLAFNVFLNGVVGDDGSINKLVIE